MKKLAAILLAATLALSLSVPALALGARASLGSMQGAERALVLDEWFNIDRDYTLYGTIQGEELIGWPGYSALVWSWVHNDYVPLYQTQTHHPHLIVHTYAPLTITIAYWDHISWHWQLDRTIEGSGIIDNLYIAENTRVGGEAVFGTLILTEPGTYQIRLYEQGEHNVYFFVLSGDAPTVPEIPVGAPSSWASEYVDRAIAAGLVPQNLQSLYQQAATRAEFAALAVVLYETVMGAEIAGRRTFYDTDDVNVQKMGYLEIVTGIGGGNFAPGGTLTREQAATMISRLAGALGQPLGGQAADFADSGDISGWALDAIGQMQATGIMTGVGNGNFAPGGQYTREQSIITMVRLFDVVN